MRAITSDLGPTRLLEIVLPEQASHHGTLHGVNALQIMGKAAFACATRHARCPVVMAKADCIEFRRAIRIGAVIDVNAQVVFQGRSSMTVTVEIAPDPAEAREDTPAITGRFMMVAVDRDGVPVPIPLSDTRLAEESCP